MNLTGKRGDLPPHIDDHGIYEEHPEGLGKLLAIFSCTYCKKPLPEAGLGTAFWTRGALLAHLSTCKEAPREVLEEAQGEIDKDEISRARLEEQQRYGGYNPALTKRKYSEGPAHFIEAVVLDPKDKTKILGCYTCQHCDEVQWVPDLGGFYEDVCNALLSHLSECSKTPPSSRRLAQAHRACRPMRRPEGEMARGARIRRGYDIFFHHRFRDRATNATGKGKILSRPVGYLEVSLHEPVPPDAHDILIALSWTLEEDGLTWRFQL